MSEKSIKQQIIKSAEAVKQKVKNMKNNKLDSELALETMFKPVTDPLKLLSSTHIGGAGENEEANSEYFNSGKVNLDQELTPTRKRKLSDPSVSPINTSQEAWNEIDDGTQSELEFPQNSKDDIFFETLSDARSTPNKNSVSSWSLSSEIFKDVPFGIRLVKGKPMVGTSLVSDFDNKIKIAGHVYEKTSGLVELLYKKEPDLSIVTENDKQNYKTILINTNAHRRGFEPDQQIMSSRGFKYLHIIKPLFSQYKTVSSVKTTKGKGLPLLKKVNPKIDYVYWDDPNELVERLKLLIASKDAGNTGLDNEIISILEELKECGALN
ncbi:hypothetical protein JYU34_003936 [Plutella xylostella]|uniref:DUF8207 domain-containing protein n=1 Tax=Plutella xylostella TaxID=51655 RepID=A0ABQ7PWC8_PLUXY|nr:hypothetical protein JYU34_019239 [Plutella xylostella]KAG7311076.1 hypothetical protein JYU34_003936 [Plutella xylostella]